MDSSGARRRVGVEGFLGLRFRVRLASGSGLTLNPTVHYVHSPISCVFAFLMGRLISGQPKEAATGFYGFICYGEDEHPRFNSNYVIAENCL